MRKHIIIFMYLIIYIYNMIVYNDTKNYNRNPLETTMFFHWWFDYVFFVLGESPVKAGFDGDMYIYIHTYIIKWNCVAWSAFGMARKSTTSRWIYIYIYIYTVHSWSCRSWPLLASCNLSPRHCSLYSHDIPKVPIFMVWNISLPMKSPEIPHKVRNSPVMITSHYSNPIRKFTYCHLPSGKLR